MATTTTAFIWDLESYSSLDWTVTTGENISNTSEMVGRSNGWSDLSEEAMDAQNRDYQERLSQKTAFLKSLAVDIESEAKDHHRLLDGVGDDFDGSSGLLGNSLGRVNKMLGGGRTNRQILFYVIIFVVVLFIVFYYIIARLRS